MSDRIDLLDLLARREALQLAESETSEPDLVPDLVRDWVATLSDAELQLIDAFDRAVEHWLNYYLDSIG